MHYEDDEQLEENILELVVYKHGTEKDKVFDYQIKNISECKYFCVNLLYRIHRKTNKYFKKHLKNDKVECWYKLRLKQIDYDEFEIISKIDVSDSDNEFDRLH